MAMDLMTEDGRAEAERLARQLVDGGATLTVGDGELSSLNDLGEPDEDDGGEEEEDPADFLERYDEALAQVVATRRLMNSLKEQTKRAKSDHEMALLHLQHLRKDKADKDRDEPRQLPLRQTR